MIKVEGLLGLVTLALWLFCLFDVISTDEREIRNLPKLAWLGIVLVLPLIGSIVWLVAGRPERGVARAAANERSMPDFPEYDRPGRAAATTAEGDDEFLRKVRERAEKQRKDYREQRRRDAE